MKVTLTNRRKWLIGAERGIVPYGNPELCSLRHRRYVFDPTSYASLVSQLTTLQSQYNMLKNNITHFFGQAAVGRQRFMLLKMSRRQYVR